MKYIGENAIKKLISLIKGDLNKKLDKNQGTTNSSKILGVNANGEVAPTDTEVATLVDVPNGQLKGDGTTISQAVAGTDYAAASHTHIMAQVEGLSSAIAKAEPFVVTIRITTSSGGGKTYTADKTYAEIKAAIDAGKCCYAITTGLEMNILFPALASSVGVLFTATQPDSASSVVMAILSDSSIVVQTYSTQPQIRATGLLKGSGDGNISAAVAGTDYAAANHTHSYLPLTGGTMTGPLVAQTNTSYTTAQMRNVIISTADPSGGNNGDIWLKYEA